MQPSLQSRCLLKKARTEATSRPTAGALRRTALALLGLLFSVSILQGQTLISGTINSYVDVTAIDAVNHTVTLSSTTGFANGDRILLIQMKGATIDETQTATFGTISNLNSAGNYELKTICDIQGSEVQFNRELVNSYDATGSVQLVRIPVYTDALISGADLTAASWDGSTGGVLALEVTGTLDFGSQNIDVSGLGFRGGAAADYDPTDGCIWSNIDVSYHIDVASSVEKALKGEGVAAVIPGKECGRGPQANGGGGGNGHNGGGGGGANYGAGGAGGSNADPAFFNCKSEAGLASKGLSTGISAGRIFLGGGGGSGHVNNNLVTANSGLNGGGIVLIIADEIIGNNQTIFADGGSHTTDALSDGGGGGGAGGTVVIDANTFNGTLNVSADGGNGADMDGGGFGRCMGPGGGGAGGALLLSQSSLPTGVNYNAIGGAAGVVTNSSAGCLGSSNAAGPGTSGAVVTSATIPESSSATTCGLLPVEWLSFSAKRMSPRQVVLQWATATELDNEGFAVERSANGIDFEQVAFVSGAGTTEAIQRYHLAVEANQFTYFRLKQVDFDGAFDYSATITVEGAGGPVRFSVSPNPAQGIVVIRLHQAGENPVVTLRMTDLSGRLILSQTGALDQLVNKLNQDIPSLPRGLYNLQLSTDSFQLHERLILR